MSVILPSERKTPKAIFAIAVIYILLLLGAITMVYPFAVMISASFSSAYDYHRHSPIIRAVFDRNDRFMRSLSLRFKTFPREIYPDAPREWTSWAQVAKDRQGINKFADRELQKLKDPKFCAEASARARAFLHRLAKTPPQATLCNYDPRDVARFAEERYGSLEAMNAVWPIPHKSFFDVSFSVESKRNPSTLENTEKTRAWNELKRQYITSAIERGDYVSRTMPYPLKPEATEIRNALAVQFIHHGWRDFTESALANYRLVGDYLFLRGRAFVNTILLVALTILASLTVNPFAAYALSRFRMRSTEKILLFMLATMAFPTAVTAIPGFLLIRDLGLLNTFAALVLPSVASAMSIFILKGFFDALPRELYEAAAIDGAGEWTVLLRITLPMTTPILAVNALNAFIHAYSSWEWAFLVCQKESHWTLAVWMYQMSQTFTHQPWCVMAGFVLVSIPTAVVFLVCQKVILRGIVLPSMK
jgi:ABC-type glycerol-3-phosphate transport system permease component